MNCRICSEPNTTPLLIDKHGCQWFHCCYCGGDSNSLSYADVVGKYGDSYNQIAVDDAGGYDGYIDSIQSNLKWFDSYKATVRKYDFLDVGCGNGGMLREMQKRGWSVHGFEIFKPSYFGPHVTVAPIFKATLFPQQYDALLCRETIEHVDDWRSMLGEMVKAVVSGGLLQIQCPRPWHENHPIVYQETHLQAIPPYVLKIHLESAGFTVLDRWIWDAGQAWMCRKRK